MIKKVKATKTIEVPQEVQYDVFQTSDDKQFENENDAIEHEKVGIIKTQNLKSNIINNKYLTQYIGNFKFVKFEMKIKLKHMNKKYVETKMITHGIAGKVVKKSLIFHVGLCVIMSLIIYVMTNILKMIIQQFI